MKIQRQPFAHTTPAICPIPCTVEHQHSSALFMVPARGCAYIGQDASKGAREGGSAKEERDTELPLPSLVPHREVVHDAGEETRLGDTEKKTGNKEARQILDYAHECGNDPPQNGQGRQPESRSCPLENDVAGNLGLSRNQHHFFIKPKRGGSHSLQR